MAIFFISDAHLGENHPEREKLKLVRLHSFLDMVKARATELYIVGDLFDFWFEYRHAVPKDHLEIVLRLAELRRHGLKLTYITGNHDHWLGSFLEQQVGFTVYRDQTELRLDGIRVLISHGDGLAAKDRGYRILKRILRNRVNIFLYRLLSPDIGIPLAKFISLKSRGHSQKRPKEGFLAEYREYARRRIAEGYGAVILAHTHVPELTEFPGGTYVNTGDWVEHFSYLELADGRFALKQWPASGGPSGG